MKIFDKFNAWRLKCIERKLKKYIGSIHDIIYLSCGSLRNSCDEGYCGGKTDLMIRFATKQERKKLHFLVNEVETDLLSSFSYSCMKEHSPGVRWYIAPQIPIHIPNHLLHPYHTSDMSKYFEDKLDET